MQLVSLAFGNNEDIPLEYSCDGEGTIPPLTVEDVPDDAKSLALIVDDPDAPSGIFTHWIVWNINPKTEDIEEGELPPGSVQGINSSGGKGYTPPCPPAGKHHYVFTLYALDILLDLSPGTDEEELKVAMGEHIISQAQLVGIYGYEEDHQDELV